LKRNLTLSVLALMVFFTSFVSCRKDAELSYSCDPGINEFVLVNLQKWEGISLTEINQYGIDTQRAIFNAISTENCAALWHEKIDFLIANKVFEEQYNENLNELKSRLSSHVYGDSVLTYGINSYISERFQSKVNNDTLILYAFYRLTIDSYANFVTMNFEIPDPYANDYAGLKNCKCSTSSSGSVLPDCLPSYTCSAGGCNKKSWGCGELFLYSCNGLCK